MYLMKHNLLGRIIMGLKNQVNQLVSQENAKQQELKNTANKAYNEFINFENNFITPLVKEYVSIMKENNIPFNVDSRGKKTNPHHIVLDVLNDYGSYPNTCTVAVLAHENGAWSYDNFGRPVTKDEMRKNSAKKLASYSHSESRRTTYLEAEAKVAATVLETLKNFGKA